LKDFEHHETDGCGHPEVHCVIPAGGLSPDHTRWIRSREKYFLPKEVLAVVFRGKFVDALKLAFQDGQLNFQANLKVLLWEPDARSVCPASIPFKIGMLMSVTMTSGRRRLAADTNSAPSDTVPTTSK